MSDTTPCAHHQFFGTREFCPDCGLSRTEVLVEACAPFLKDGETPAECIARNRRDVDGCLTMLIAERRKVEALRSRLAEAEALLQEVYDGRQSLMSVGLVYRIGHTLNHRPADSAPAAAEPWDESKCTCVYATSANTAAVRHGYEMGGYVKEQCDYCKAHAASQPSSASACEHDFARRGDGGQRCAKCGLTLAPDQPSSAEPACTCGSTSYQLFAGADTNCPRHGIAPDQPCDVHTGGCDGRHEIYGPQPKSGEAGK